MNCCEKFLNLVTDFSVYCHLERNLIPQGTCGIIPNGSHQFGCVQQYTSRLEVLACSIITDVNYAITNAPELTLPPLPQNASQTPQLRWARFAGCFHCFYLLLGSCLYNTIYLQFKTSGASWLRCR